MLLLIKAHVENHAYVERKSNYPGKNAPRESDA